MKLEFKKLDMNSHEDYERLLHVSSSSMLYHSLKYRTFLKEILPDAEDYYLLGYSEGRLIGALPMFRKEGRFGTVVNSLPFYGSHGALIAEPKIPHTARRAFFEKFENLCDDWGAVFSTVITTPLNEPQSVSDTMVADYLDERIGQIIELPAVSDSMTVGETVMEMLHQKTRNSVRKGLSSGFAVGDDGSETTFRALHQMHHENISSVGGLPKSFQVFSAIQAVFEYGRDYKIYWAKNEEGRIISALLVMFFQDWVEYFVPATDPGYRSSQPMSMLIYRVLQDAVVSGLRYWNWGGTWLSQDGVYKFKSRWGTKDYPYRYYIRCHCSIEGLSKHELLSEYPHFFTLPFSEIHK